MNHQRSLRKDMYFQEIARERSLGEDEDVMSLPFLLDPIPDPLEVTRHVSLFGLELHQPHPEWRRRALLIRLHGPLFGSMAYRGGGHPRPQI